MGKKTKIGKQRKDKYYHLAKETGYRSRAAFKLIQLNRKFEFLQRAHCLIDLCAAPGGWLQVAKEFMPMSSLIIGVDLAPIKSVSNVITLQEDITTDSCKKAIERELKTWLADVVLNDGAPNVGKTWIHDAFMQAQLTLSALKLATKFLRKGGYFVTKVFRSKDYPALIATFGKLFRKVHATKPEASRMESAEIFVVCEGYLKPDKVDLDLVDPLMVFKEHNLEPTKAKMNLVTRDKTKKAKAEGYAEGQGMILVEKLPVSRFLCDAEYMDLLANATEIVFDDPRIKDHRATTETIKTSCADIRVCGRREIRELLNWRKEIRSYLSSLEVKEKKDVETEVVSEDEEVENDKMVAEAKLAEKQDAKRKRKVEMKDKRKLRDKVELKMIIPGDRPDYPDMDELFDLSSIKTKKTLDNIFEVEAPGDILMEDDQTELVETMKAKPSTSDDAKESRWYFEDVVSIHSEDDSEAEKSDDDDLYAEEKVNDDEDMESTDDKEDVDEDGPPLIYDLDPSDKKTKEDLLTRQWFERDIFEGLENEDDEDAAIEKMTEIYRKKQEAKSTATPDQATTEPISKPKKRKLDTLKKNTTAAVPESDDDDFTDGTGAKDQLEIVPISTKTRVPALKKKRLDPESLALGEMMIHSSKAAREIDEWGYNRFTNNDTSLPDWFVEDEKKHYKKALPVTKEMVADYKARLLAVDARPIKRVAEAKARKKKRTVRRMERAKKRAAAIVDNPELGEKEKAQEMRKVYKKAAELANQKPEVTYIVAKKGQVGRRVRRPAGVKGQFKMVDPRMKKDLRKMKSSGGAKKGRGAAAKKPHSAGKKKTTDSAKRPSKSGKGKGKGKR